MYGVGEAFGQLAIGHPDLDRGAGALAVHRERSGDRAAPPSHEHAGMLDLPDYARKWELKNPVDRTAIAGCDREIGQDDTSVGTGERLLVLPVTWGELSRRPAMMTSFFDAIGSTAAATPSGTKTPVRPTRGTARRSWPPYAISFRRHVTASPPPPVLLGARKIEAKWSAS